MRKRVSKLLLATVCPVLGLSLLTGCKLLRRADMYYQPHKRPYQASSFFADGMSARPIVAGTVARSERYDYKSSEPNHGEPMWAVDEADPTGFPSDFPTAGPALADRLARGQQRFNIYCSPCHGLNGLGDGMIPQRGFTKPPSFIVLNEDATKNPQRYEREQYLQTAPPRHIYDVITNGVGAMYSYAERVQPEDRWAIVAYVKTLQTAKPATQPSQQPPSATIGADKTRQTGN